MSANIHIFTHHDLDGIGSLLALIWAFPDANITYTTVSSSHTFEEEFTKFNAKTPLRNYSKVFVTDLSIQSKDIPLVDKENVIIIDHHKTSLSLTFTRANTFIKEYSSCSMLIYKIFKSSISINKLQKYLLLLIDDYDSYTHNFANSKKLNTLYWAHYKDCISLFLEHFNNGFESFNSFQQNIIANYEQKSKTTIYNLQKFTTQATIQNQKCKIVAAFSSTHINDVADSLLHTHAADIAIVINLNSSRVSFRKNKTCSVDVSLLAHNLCDGGGHEAAAGGALTEKFLTFSKLFTPL